MAKGQTQPDDLQKLKTDIRNHTVGRLYIFHGEEQYLLDHYLNQLKILLIDEVTESFNFHKLNSESFSLEMFAEAVENLPMMAESTLVWVDDVDIFKMNEADRTRMTEVLSDIPEYCTVVFTYETVPWKPDKRYKKLWEAVDRNGSIVEFAKQDQDSLIPWVTRHFAGQKKRINPKLCAYLIDITGGTMTALAGEISKICAYSGADEIVKADIDAVVEPVLDAIVFDMTDMLGQGQYGPAILKLRQLLKMEQEATAILGAIGYRFRQLGTAKTLYDHGKRPGDLHRLCGIPERAAAKTMEAARRFQPKFFETAAKLVLETDYKMKTSFDDPERLLEMLVLELAQEARRA